MPPPSSRAEANSALRVRLLPGTGCAVAPPQGEFWDESALYIGAIRPGAARDWTDGWTDFPLN